MPPRSRIKAFSITFKTGWKRRPKKNQFWSDLIIGKIKEKHFFDETGPIRCNSDQIWYYLGRDTPKPPERYIYHQKKKHNSQPNNLRIKKSAPTKFVYKKWFMKQDHHDAKRARASPCMVRTYNSSKKQQEAATLCSIPSSTVAAVVVSYAWHK